jgi:hypothetical protein
MIVSLLFMVIVSAKRGDHQPADGSDDSGPSGVVSTLTVIPELLSEVAGFVRSMTSK